MQNRGPTYTYIKRGFACGPLSACKVLNMCVLGLVPVDKGAYRHTHAHLIARFALIASPTRTHVTKHEIFQLHVYQWP